MRFCEMTPTWRVIANQILHIKLIFNTTILVILLRKYNLYHLILNHKFLFLVIIYIGVIIIYLYTFYLAFKSLQILLYNPLLLG